MFYLSSLIFHNFYLNTSYSVKKPVTIKKLTTIKDLF